jgi:hypothetical protein
MPGTAAQALPVLDSFNGAIPSLDIPITEQGPCYDHYEHDITWFGPIPPQHLAGQRLCPIQLPEGPSSWSLYSCSKDYPPKGSHRTTQDRNRFICESSKRDFEQNS